MHRRIRLAALAALLSASMAAGEAAAGDISRRLLDALRDNGTITAEQHETMTRSLAEQGKSARVEDDESDEADEAVVRRLVEVLHGNGTLDEDAYADVLGVARGGAAVTTADLPAAEPPVGKERAQRDDDDRINVDIGSGGLVVESADGESSFALGGRVHVDAGWYDSDDSEIGDGSEVRRARIELDGVIKKDWEYSAGFEFGGNELDLKSTYISYVGFDPVELSIGNFKEPFSLEEISSSNSNTFMERASANVLAPGRNPGAGVSAYGDHWTLAGGVFAQGSDNENADGVDESWGATGRATVAPINEKARLLHLGAATSYREHDKRSEVRFRERWDSHLTDDRLVDTDVLTGVDDILRYNVEAAGVLGPFSVQGEYLAASVDRTAGATSLYLDGWYAYASWVLTGESRTYKSKRARMDGVKPDAPVGDGGLGAWEVGARYGVLDLSDDDVEGGRQDVLTLGLNWYVTRNVRFMANWVRVLELDRPGTEEDGDQPSVFQVRSQVNF